MSLTLSCPMPAPYSPQKGVTGTRNPLPQGGQKIRAPTPKRAMHPTRFFTCKDSLATESNHTHLWWKVLTERPQRMTESPCGPCPWPITTRLQPLCPITFLHGCPRSYQSSPLFYSHSFWHLVFVSRETDLL